jgi:hypothetical protein
VVVGGQLGEKRTVARGKRHFKRVGVHCKLAHSVNKKPRGKPKRGLKDGIQGHLRDREKSRANLVGLATVLGTFLVVDRLGYYLLPLWYLYRLG